MCEIGAKLKQLTLSSEQPQILEDFYRKAYRFDHGEHVISGNGEAVSLEFIQGTSGQMYQLVYVFDQPENFQRYREKVAQNIRIDTFSEHAFMVHDPLGHRLVFQYESPQALPEEILRLQHVGLRVQEIQQISEFYEHVLGFTISDRVLNDQDELTAIFMRTDEEHHSMALFKSPINRFDHFSFEINDWHGMKYWADHMAASEIELVWGIGRHGPGNDTFFMIRDVDGNMGEISAELERCEPNRPVGYWKHHPLTLNQWGVAIMRC
ncbi:catechol 2,3-dioxygenase [Acinetobacter baylyi]|uniref:Catechol 2,3-dioxygenase n=1 Tax=Acinetobacter baylyi TaxID=202950 RepID=A0ABU0UXP5_ACIBI|nr:VOC family protein [Acinetobacter baylyi]MDQ1209335.1 catechol 2,3-dioxygenase [Acinetobacter baylyi]MDR6107072.1 catechol 2,3-dioxygenase [Acinetobacter baylyi]MDR6186207.1 catechol 2,3-dioxygenase [Acinetobacter baylyi]